MLKRGMKVTFSGRVWTLLDKQAKVATLLRRKQGPDDVTFRPYSITVPRQRIRRAR